MKHLKSRLLLAMAAALALSGFSEAHAVEPLTDTFNPVTMSTVKTEGTMILSDSPEYADAYGITARGTINGKGRIYYYHVNETGAPARVVVYAESPKKTAVSLLKDVKGDASSDYMPTGETLSFREAVAENKENTIAVPKKKKVIISEFSTKGINEDDLVSGIVDVDTKKPVTFGVAVLPYDTSRNEYNDLLDAKELPADSHEMRGTYAMDMTMENKTPWNRDEGNGEIVIGRRDDGFYLQGLDEIDNVKRENTGNYGVTVHLVVHTAGSGKYNLYMNPMGGLYEGTFFVREGDEKVPALYRINGSVRAGAVYFGNGSIEDVREMGTWHAGKDLHIDFVVAGATYLPFRFLLVPVD